MLKKILSWLFESGNDEAFRSALYGKEEAIEFVKKQIRGDGFSESEISDEFIKLVKETPTFRWGGGIDLNQYFPYI